VAQHRLIGEDLAGRPLRKGEVVHHKDNDRANNDPANLEVMTLAEHRAHHFAELSELLRIPVDPAELKTALAEAGSVKGAARKLGIDHNVLRRRFPELCKPFRRRSPLVFDNPRDLKRIREAAADPSVGQKTLARELGMSTITVQRICERHGWKWKRRKWADDDPRRLALSASQTGLKADEKTPVPVRRSK
jgi:hypothetical protein